MTASLADNTAEWQGLVVSEQKLSDAGKMRRQLPGDVFRLTVVLASTCLSSRCCCHLEATEMVLPLAVLEMYMPPPQPAPAHPACRRKKLPLFATQFAW